MKNEDSSLDKMTTVSLSVIGLLGGGPSVLDLARSQIMEYVNGSTSLGHMPGGMSTDGGVGEQVPGVLTWAAMLLYEKEPMVEGEGEGEGGAGVSFLAAVYPAFATNNRWWYENNDADGNGLCEWFALVSGW